MGWRVANGIVVLQKELDSAFPNRTKPDWTVADKYHPTSSDHHPDNPKHPGVVTAVDVRGADVADALGEHLRKTKDRRVKYYIHNKRLFSSYDHSNGPAWSWRPYYGSNGHIDHGHLSLLDSSSRYDDTHSWGLANVLVKDDEVEELIKHIQTGLKKAGFYTGAIDGIWGKLSQGAWDSLCISAKEDVESHNHDRRYVRRGTSVQLP